MSGTPSKRVGRAYSIDMQALDTALYSKLTEGSTTLYGLVGTRVYRGLAPGDAAMPYVVYNVQAGGYDNETYKDSATVVYQVKGVAQSGAAAANVDTAIAAQLHNTGYTVTAWTLVSSMRENDTGTTELVNGVPVFNAGALYRIRISK